MNQIENYNVLNGKDGHFQTLITNRLVKYCDLNHHGTLFAGRGAEWFVESGFIAVASLTAPENIVCVKVHGMIFKKPVAKGAIVQCEGTAVHAGKTSITAYVRIIEGGTGAHIVDGFLTFVHVAANGQPTPHGLNLHPGNAGEKELQMMAKSLK